jgi:hypothetical protein
MASSGTLLSDLTEGSAGAADSDLVKKIFADMNMSSGSNPQMIMSPNPNTVAPIQMDSQPPTSHIIGKDHPTPGDFAAAIHGVPRMQESQGMLPPPIPAGATAPQPWMNYQAPPPQQVLIPETPTKNMYARIADELKMPLLVTILVFVFSLPFLNILFNHYIPSLVKPSGDLTTVGLLSKSVLAGISFWILQRVIAPLLSL